MARISVNEPNPNPKPPADNTDPERKRRRKVMADASKLSKDMKAEGRPPAQVFQRVVVQLSGGDSWQCPNCSQQPWGWQAVCPRCGTLKPTT